MDVMNLVAKLSLNDSDYKSKLSAVKSGASSVGSSISSSFSKAGNGFSSLGGKISNMGGKISAFGGKITSMATQFAPLSAAAGAVFLPAVKGAMNYQDAVAKVSTLVDTSKVPVKQLSATFMDLSNETGKSATELAEAGYQALSAGVKVDKMKGFVKTATNLSKVGFTDSATAVDVLTTAMNAYGKSGGSAESIANKLVKTQNLGKTTVSELASTMGRVIPNASSLGVNINNLSAAYISMTKQGIKTRIATTNINSMLGELGDSGSTVAGILKEKTGKSFQELMEGGASLTDVLKILEEGADESGTSFRELWSDSTASTGALALMANDGKEFDNGLKELENDTDALGEGLKKLGSTAGAKLRKSLTQLQNAGISLGTAFLDVAAPAISKFAGFVQKVSLAIQNMNPKVKQAIMIVLGIVTAVTPVLLAIGGAISLIGTLVTVIGGVVTAIGLLSSPLGLLVAGIVAAIAATVLIVKHWKQLETAAKNLFEKLKVSFDQIRQAILNAWDAVRRATTNAWNAVKNAVTNAWKNIKTTVSNAINAVKSTISNIWNSIKSVTGNVWSSIKETIGNAIDGAKDAVNIAVSAIKRWLMFTNIINIVKTVFNGIRDSIKDPINTAKNAVKTAYDNIKKWLPFSGLAKTVSNTFNSIKKAISDPINTAKGVVEGAVKKIKGLFPLKLGNIFKLNLPKFEIVSKGSPPFGLLGKGSLPKWKVSWKKKGMSNLLALDGATIFGAMGGNMLGGGEAGRELVVGEKYAIDMIRKASNNENVEVLLVQLIGLLERWLPTKTIAYVNKNDISQSVNRELGKLLV